MLEQTGFEQVQIGPPYDTFGDARGEANARAFIDAPWAASSYRRQGGSPPSAGRPASANQTPPPPSSRCLNRVITAVPALAAQPAQHADEHQVDESEGYRWIMLGSSGP